MVGYQPLANSQFCDIVGVLRFMVSACGPPWCRSPLGVEVPLVWGMGDDDGSDGLLLPRETVGKPTMVVVAVHGASGVPTK